MKTKVLIASGGLNVGGAEKWLIDFISNVDSNKFEFGFILHGKGEHFFESIAKDNGAIIHKLDNPKNIFSYIMEIHEIQKKHDYKIIHGHVNHFSVVYLLLKLFSNVKVIIHSHNDLSAKIKNSNWIRKLYFKVSSILISQYADALIGVSNKAAKSIFNITKANEEKYYKIYCGLDLDSLQKRILTNETLNGKLDSLSKVSTKLVFHIGRFVEQKNHSFILDVAQLSDQSIHFCLFGDGPLKEKIETLCEKKGIRNISFFGNTKDVDVLLYKYADCMILPSLHEGLPVVLMESQACGLRSLISTNVSRECDVSESLIDYLDLTRASDWADKINLIDKRESSINEDFVGSKFDIKKSSRLICDVYLKVLEK